MEQLVLIIHVLVAIAIIGLIMIQQGKGADMGASFGAGASQTLFGSAGGGNALTKATSWLVTLFFLTSFGLAYFAKQNADAVGAVDIPAVVETPAVDDQPVIDEAAIQRAMEQGGLDIPGGESPIEPAGDIPE